VQRENQVIAVRPVLLQKEQVKHHGQHDGFDPDSDGIDATGENATGFRERALAAGTA
jgi:hypothetical protein